MTRPLMQYVLMDLGCVYFSQTNRFVTASDRIAIYGNTGEYRGDELL